MKKLTVTLFMLTVILITNAAVAFAQIPIGVGPGDGDGNTTPIGGMAILAALGGGYAIKKLRDGRRET